MSMTITMTMSMSHTHSDSEIRTGLLLNFNLITSSTKTDFYTIHLNSIIEIDTAIVKMIVNHKTSKLRQNNVNFIIKYHCTR